MWTLEVTSEWDRQFKYYTKKRPRELKAALDNLDTLHKTLVSGVRLQDARFGFIHVEPLGVLAVDQKGGGPNLAQMRLYLYPDEKQRVLHLLTIGDKNSQRADIANCKTFVTQLRQIGEQTRGQENASH